MKRPKLPALDQADRRIVGIGIILVLAFVVACAAIGAGLGLGVRMFALLSGW